MFAKTIIKLKDLNQSQIIRNSKSSEQWVQIYNWKISICQIKFNPIIKANVLKKAQENY